MITDLPRQVSYLKHEESAHVAGDRILERKQGLRALPQRFQKTQERAEASVAGMLIRLWFNVTTAGFVCLFVFNLVARIHV